MLAELPAPTYLLFDFQCHGFLHHLSIYYYKRYYVFCPTLQASPNIYHSDIQALVGRRRHGTGTYAKDRLSRRYASVRVCEWKVEDETRDGRLLGGKGFYPPVTQSRHLCMRSATVPPAAIPNSNVMI